MIHNTAFFAQHKNIKIWLIENKITGKEFAEMLGIKPSSVSHYIKSGYSLLEFEDGSIELHQPNKRINLN